MSSPSSTRRLGLAVAFGVSTAVSLLAGAPAALAASAAPHASQTNWFWREQPSTVGGVAPPAAAPDPSVPPGDLAVAGPTDKQGADKESYVEFDVSAIPAGSTFTQFTITVPLDPKAHQGFLPGPLPTVVACAVASSWAGGDGAEAFSGKPADDCGHKVVGTPANGGKAYAFSITSIAQTWLGPDGINTGVALTDDPANKSSAYEVVLGPTNTITASASWNPPAAPAAQSPPPTTPRNSSATPVTTNASSNDGGTGSAGGAVLQPQAPPATSPPVVPAPQVVPSAPLERALPIVNPTAVSSLPPALFWVVACILAAVLGAAALVLRDPVVSVPGGVRRGVGRALLRRTASGRPSAVIVPRSSP